MTYEDILFDVKDGVATVTINRPQVMNAFRGQTCEELIHALNRAGWDKSIGVIVLAGAGDRAFCTGGDQSAHDGQYDGRGMIGLPVEELQSLIRDVPKPGSTEPTFGPTWPNWAFSEAMVRSQSVASTLPPPMA